jgi:adenylate cyclase
MAVEIERKYLVADDSWLKSAGRPIYIRQAYLARNEKMSLRIRIMDGVKAAMTLKSAGAAMRRLEFEYPVPLGDAEVMLALRYGAVIEKLRYQLPRQGLVWEVDVFQGENAGLTIAEIELPHEETEFEKPGWVGREVTSDPRYSNASLAAEPFAKW